MSLPKLTNQKVELLRILSAFGVVWFHSSIFYKNIAYSGLICFLILSAVYATTPRPMKYRAGRLLIPWIFWLIFYGLLNIYRHIPFINSDGGFIFGVLSGTSIHLWYLPFIFLVLVVSDMLKKQLHQMTLLCCCIVCLCLWVLSAAIWRHLSLSPPLGQYLHAVGAILIGLVLANINLITTKLRLLVIAALYALLFWLFVNVNELATPYLIGLTVSLLALLPTENLKIDLTDISRCTFGIYLCHPFIGLLLTKFNLANNLYYPILVFLASTLMIFFLRKTHPKLSEWII